MRKELAAIGYDGLGKQRMPKEWKRFGKYVYRASWSTAEVEHFLYLGEDTRRYFTAEFGLRNPAALEFSIEAMAKYEHANVRLLLEKSDLTTASMGFNLGCLKEISQSPWPRIHLSEISDGDLAIFVADFVRQNLLPFVQTITDLQSYFSFIVNDQAPNPWLIGNMSRAAQVVAVAAQLGRSDAEIRELLRPYESRIQGEMRHIAADKTMGIDTYLDSLISDWHRKYPEG